MSFYGFLVDNSDNKVRHHLLTCHVMEKVVGSICFSRFTRAPLALLLLRPLLATAGLVESLFRFFIAFLETVPVTLYFELFFFSSFDFVFFFFDTILLNLQLQVPHLVFVHSRKFN